ncbi:hypothetical protein LXT12_09980 [Pelomonas sp. P7]|uniref:PEP-CTERM protein-sorting domain-containing protein n=1 Tax=Pelomonas caseinilytica TaxID=2906763 RepID=A0ABS8XDS6_9BURK|nr:hypothetical protein [Pelomonas sp. P7]MCE4537577.1 hypothetical protein [Pelomonas sp. P7]
MPTIRSLRGLLAAGGCALGLAASAAPVSYAFSGTVLDDEAGRGYQAFAGRFSFDTAAPELTGDPTGHTGAYTGPGWALTLSFDGGAELLFGDSLFVTVTDDLGGQDQWGLLATGAPGTISAALFDANMAALSGNGLPLRDGGYTLADFGASQLRWDSDLGALQGQFSALACTAGCQGGGGGPVTPPNELPEPGSLLLVLIAIGLMPWKRRTPGRRP